MEVFDRSLALKRLGGDEARLDLLIDVYLKSVPGTMEVLEMNAEKQLAEPLKQEAEVLRVSSQQIGAEGMEDLAAQMSEAAETADFEKIQTLITHMGMEFDWLSRILDQNRCSGNL